MKPKKMQERLRKRIDAHGRFMNKYSAGQDGVEKRKRSGGYRCPGSPKQSG
jgi:hypothetical protein